MDKSLLIYLLSVHRMFNSRNVLFLCKIFMKTLILSKPHPLTKPSV